MRTDVLLNSEYDLDIQRGDFVVGICDEQNVDLLLKSSKGDFRQYALVGVSLYSYVNSVQLYKLRERVNKALKDDGYKLNLLFNNNGVWEIDFS